jgi:hypothetical protein
MPIHLYTEYYLSSNAQRQEEIDCCLLNNLNNPLIDKVFIFCEINLPNIQHPKIRVLKTNKRLTFSMFFSVIEKSEDSCINILANADIHFNATIAHCYNLRHYQCYALSRYDKHLASPINVITPFWRNDSQDAWVVRGASKLKEAHFCLGIPGCDNRIAYLLKDAGYEILNPCSYIQAIHLHDSNYRTYKNSDGNNNSIVDGPYYFVTPS